MCSILEQQSLKMPSQPPKFKVFRKKPKKYNKLSTENLEILKEFYIENRYPSKQVIQSLAEQMGEKMEKIQNWFKHERKKQVLSGIMKYEKKNAFTKEQHNFLLKNFEISKKPTCRQYQELALHINCKIKNVKNWFSYNRKKFLKQQKSNKIEANSTCASTQQSKPEETQSTTISQSFKSYNKCNYLKPVGEKIQAEIPINNCQNYSQNTIPLSNTFSAIKRPVPVIAIPLNSQLGVNLLMKNNVAANMQANSQMLQSLQVIMGQILKNQQYLNLVNMTLGVQSTIQMRNDNTN